MYVTLDRLAEAAASFFVDILGPRISATFGAPVNIPYSKDTLEASWKPIIQFYFPTLKALGYLNTEGDKLDITKAKKIVDSQFDQQGTISFPLLGKVIFLTKDDKEKFFRYLLDYIDADSPIALGYSK